MINIFLLANNLNAKKQKLNVRRYFICEFEKFPKNIEEEANNSKYASLHYSVIYSA